MANLGQGLWLASLLGGFPSVDASDWANFDVEYVNTIAWLKEMQEVPDWVSLADWLNDYGSTTVGQVRSVRPRKRNLIRTMEAAFQPFQ